jgi:hypothetical protein
METLSTYQAIAFAGDIQAAWVESEQCTKAKSMPYTERMAYREAFAFGVLAARRRILGTETDKAIVLAWAFNFNGL